jgi:hypothetical protein
MELKGQAVVKSQRSVAMHVFWIQHLRYIGPGGVGAVNGIAALSEKWRQRIRNWNLWGGAVCGISGSAGGFSAGGDGTAVRIFRES